MNQTRNQILLSQQNPIMQGHQIYGDGLLPALAYIDLLYQLFRGDQNDLAGLTLRDLVIHRPLRVTDTRDVLLDITWTCAGDGCWQISVDGQNLQNGVLDGRPDRYATAEMRREHAQVFNERIDIGRIRTTASLATDLEVFYARCRSHQLQHQGYMLTHGTLFALDDAVYVECLADQPSGNGVAHSRFHPGLIDASAVAIFGSIAGSAEDATRPPFLPVSYQWFQASASLQTYCVARMRRTSVQRKGDLSGITIEFFDESGDKVAELRNLMIKSIGHEVVRDRTNGHQVVEASLSPLESFLRGLLAERLQLSPDRVARDVGYFELGLDSAGLMDVVQAMSRQLGVPLAPTLLFEYPTVATLAAHLEQKLAGRKIVLAGLADTTASPAVTAPSSLEQLLQQLVAERLQVPPQNIARDIGYFELGLDSAGLMDVVQSMGRHLGAPLAPTLLFEYPTIAALAAHLAQKLDSRKIELPAVNDVRAVGRTSAAPSSLEALLQSLLAKQLQLPPERVARDAGYFEMGLDSAGLMDVVQSMSRHVGIPLAPTLLFEYPTIAALAAHLSPKLADRTIAWPPTNSPDRGPEADPVVAAGTSLELLLQRLVAERLQLPPELVPFDVGYFELGLDSAGLMDVVESMGGYLGAPLAPTLLFEYPTIAALAAHLSRHTEGLPVPIAALERPGDVDPITAGRAEAAPVSRSIQLSDERQSIAIIAMNGRFPKADTLDAYWENMLAGRDAIDEVPPDRWPLDGFYCADKDEAIRRQISYSRFGGFLDAIDHFDCDFFGMSPAEASHAGPSQLLFLEVVWNLLETAGYTRDALQREYQSNVGVYVGAMPGTQNYFGASEGGLASQPLTISAIAHRVSKVFGLTGPSLAIDTQSASSMTALHLACEALIRGECDMAITGGVNILYPEQYFVFAQYRSLASRLESRSFTHADGAHLSEAVGAVLLKPLARAIQDGDTVLAVLKSTGIAYSARGGATTDIAAEAGLFERVTAKAGLDPRSISYIEAAANGSPMGDLLEVAALSKVFRKHSDELQFCAVGSTKSNIGHAVAASGVSQLIKVVLQLQHRKLVPLLDCVEWNPGLLLDESPFRLQRELTEWKRPVVILDGESTVTARRAMVNSFGVSGAFASAVVEEYVAPERQAEAGAAEPLRQLIVLSARSALGLRAKATDLLAFLASQPSVRLADLAYTLQVGRDGFVSRLALIVNDLEGLSDGLQFFLAPDSAVQDNGIRLFVNDGEEITTHRIKRSGQRVDGQSLEAIAADWVRGGEVEWSNLLRPGHVRRVGLPTYPFEKKKLPSLGPYARARRAISDALVG